MKTTKITATFLAVVLVTGALTFGMSVLVDDAFASGDKKRDKHKDRDRHYDDYDREYKKYDREYDSYDKKDKYGYEEDYKKDKYGYEPEYPKYER